MYNCLFCGERFNDDRERCPICGSEEIEGVPTPREKFIDDVLKERRRQLLGEGRTDKHDDGHVREELASAAACYASPSPLYRRVDQHHGGVQFLDPWPWDKESSYTIKKGKSRRRQLVIAAALILAEAERLERREDAVEESKAAYPRPTDYTRVLEKFTHDIGVSLAGKYVSGIMQAFGWRPLTSMFASQLVFTNADFPGFRCSHYKADGSNKVEYSPYLAKESGDDEE